jgi:cytochrome c peroxidase
MKSPLSFRTLPIAALIAIGMFFGTGCKEATPGTVDNSVTEEPSDNLPTGIIPKSFPAMNIPSNNPMTAAKIELGRHLFYDPQMSTSKTVSCASCHIASSGFADNIGVSAGVKGRMGNLNAMTLVNLGHYDDYGWNGRFKSLEEHAPGPIFNFVELGFGRDPNLVEYYGDPDSDTLILFGNLDDRPEYKTLFKDAFGSEKITIDRIAKAIASFERTFESTTSPFDAFNNGKKDALSANALRGYKLFTDASKTNCLGCHNGPNFTDGQFHVNGISVTTKNKGRADRTGNSEDIGKFRTPSLRNAGVTWPYMHDGSISGANPTAALEEVIRRYSEGGDGRLNQDPKIKKLNLGDQDIADLAAFIQSLTDTKFLHNPALQNPW